MSKLDKTREKRAESVSVVTMLRALLGRANSGRVLVGLQSMGVDSLGCEAEEFLDHLH